MTIPLDAFLDDKSRDSLHSNIQSFVGFPVLDYDPNTALRSDVAYRFRSTWDEAFLIPHLRHFVASAVAGECQALVVGAWQGDDSQASADEVISFLSSHREKLPKLQALYLGDIVSEENEMSWIEQGELSPLLEAFPTLQFLRSRGGEGLALSRAQHPQLRGLALETGGMNAGVVQSLGQSHFPKLEHLELWLGTQEYGGTVSVSDLEPILSGRLFPNLKYLGLRNSEMADQLASALVDSPLLSRLETLDLSLGTLGDVGGAALLKLQSPTLKRLNLHYHYMSDDVSQSVQNLPFSVDISKPEYMDEDEGYRFVAVGE